MKKIAVVLAGTLALGLVCWVLYLDGRWGYLILSRGSVIEVNGVAVDGDVLEKGFVTIVTRRDAGKQHSYLLNYAGDVDSVGNLGFVTDCHVWVAPRFPLLIVTRSYPPCKQRPDEAKQPWVWSLTSHPKGVKFSTPTQEVIAITEPQPR